MNTDTGVKGRSQKPKNDDWSGDIPQSTDKTVRNIPISALVLQLNKTQREKLTSGCNMMNLAKIFEDADMMNTAEKFLACGMNVCRAARELYMHRNTLVYRLNRIRRQTGLDLRDFDMAVTFRILHILYLMR